jgi:hypothetical protein
MNLVYNTYRSHFVLMVLLHKPSRSFENEIEIYGWGLDGVNPASLIRVINSCREGVYGGLSR